MFFDRLEELFNFIIRRWYYIIILAIAAVPIVFFMLPPTYFLNKANVFYGGQVGFTQSRGSVWSGGALFHIPSLGVVEQPVNWKGHLGGDGWWHWDIFVNDFKKATVFYSFSKNYNIKLYSVPIPLKVLVPKEKVELISGEISLSGLYDLSRLIGKGKLDYLNVVMIGKNGLPITIGSGNANWGCVYNDKAQCLIQFDSPTPPFNISGQLILAYHSIAGRGTFQPADPNVMSMIVPIWQEPLRIKWPNPQDPSWKWGLPKTNFEIL